MVNKKGLSDVVSTVLIILLVLAAVGILGSILLKQIRSTGSKIETTLGCQDVVLTPVSCINIAASPSGVTPIIPVSTKVLVSRGNEGAFIVIPSIDIIFEDSTKINKVFPKVGQVDIPIPAPVALETKSYTFDRSTGTYYASVFGTAVPAQVSVAATIRSSNGKDVKCPASTAKVFCTGP